MTSKDAALMVDITQDIIRKLWLGDISEMLKYIDDDFILVDTNQHRFLHGKNELVPVLPQIIKEAVKHTMADKRFILAQNCGNACTVVGQYSLFPDDETSPAKMMQSCVFTWEMAPDNRPILKHIGVTKPEIVDDSAEILIPEITAANPQTSAMPQKLVITDLNECTRFITRNDILYATSDGRNTMIHCFNGDINARISISAFLKQAGSTFISIHRCYAVNVNHITTLKPYSVVLCDGSELPVPVKRYGEIRQKLTAILGSYDDIK